MLSDWHTRRTRNREIGFIFPTYASASISPRQIFSSSGVFFMYPVDFLILLQNFMMTFSTMLYGNHTAKRCKAALAVSGSDRSFDFSSAKLAPNPHKLEKTFPHVLKRLLRIRDQLFTRIQAGPKSFFVAPRRARLLWHRFPCRFDQTDSYFLNFQDKFVSDQDPDEESTGRVTLKDGIDLELIDTASSINSKIPSSEFGTTAEKFQGLALQAINVDSCHGFILCFSLARKETFEALKKYYEFILAYVLAHNAQKSSKHFFTLSFFQFFAAARSVKATSWWPLVLVGTHSDIVRSDDDQGAAKSPRAVSAAEIAAFCSACHDAPFVEISAKEGSNVNTVLRKISRCIQACTTKAS